MDKICAFCGKNFYVKPSDYDERKYCSKKCYGLHRTLDHNWTTKICEICGSVFSVKPSHYYKRVTCSKKCLSQHRKLSIGEKSGKYEGIVKKCIVCGNEFHTKKSHYSRRKCCSKKCYALFQRTALTNEKNANWRGGLSSEGLKIRSSANYKEWRFAVFTRDNFSCALCGAKGVYINAHHIKRFVDNQSLRLDINNGVTLCENCHHLVNRKEEEYEPIFLDKVRRAGGSAFVARSVEDVENVLLHKGG